MSRADMTGADLYGAKGPTDKELTPPNTLEGATMPHGHKYEECLRDKEVRREDGENDRPS